MSEHVFKVVELVKRDVHLTLGFIVKKKYNEDLFNKIAHVYKSETPHTVWNE